MNWNKLTQLSQIEDIKELSEDIPVMIFKHSTRCSLSGMSLDRLLRNWKEEDHKNVLPYHLDIIENRELSNQISKEFGIPHQSPQILVIKKGISVYDNSHFGISYPEIMDVVKK